MIGLVMCIHKMAAFNSNHSSLEMQKSLNQ